jgi:hypothetical protein
MYNKIPGVSNIRSCVLAVAASFEAYDPSNLNQAFLSLLQNYNLLLKHKGSNKYKVPNMGKERLERTGQLPVTIAVADMVVPDNVLDDINEDGIGELIDKNFDSVFDFGLD